MKTKLLSLVTASMLLVTSANAAQRYISVGYASGSINGASSAGAVVEVGVKTGDTFKHKIGTKFVFLGENDDWTDGQGNLMNLYYSLGYDVYSGIVLSGIVGMGIQEIGTIGTGSNKTTVNAIGLSYGINATYEISESFDIGVSYIQNDLEFLTQKYSIGLMEASLSYKF